MGRSWRVPILAETVLPQEEQPVRTRKRLLTALATGSAVVGGGVALGQVRAPATQLVAARASASPAGHGKSAGSADQQLRLEYERAQRLTADIAAIQRQINALLA